MQREYVFPPSYFAAQRALSDCKTSPEVRVICTNIMSECLGGSPTRMLTPDELSAIDMSPPRQYRCEPVGMGDDDQKGGGVIVVMCIAVFFTLSMAMYGAVKLGGDVVRLMLGVGSHIQTEEVSK